MPTSKHRYVQPTGPLDAMKIVQKLFNQYRNAPLTAELMSYHQDLVTRLQSDIKEAVEQADDPNLSKNLASMTALMQSWTAIRLSGRPFPGKMHHFKLDTQTGPRYKVKNHKIGRAGAHRSSRH
ncbi:MAG: hypothetical protein LKJ72_02855 [[Lactobacillus] timonensis]|jgi:hypothetical protein|uniref:hypothetical protein n=1 Tax=[Lactobacillus] timonensis TaxID=1970790 RepID=UPI000C8555CE|nr:hypothetical protein [[Lactobacillus] timonensis]MCI1925981.1 hypothetical protein [[Lactobacillus] timonensis]MCI1957301.1 hypothetical protein [[Lactobacillus] timonensis]MCI1970350.1 hypothetical protein [[Lactobacillus] timonensis]MCI2006495.1 hypothetical protein [[Lactobacillus] timonensis]